MSASLPAEETRAYLKTAVRAHKLPQLFWGLCILATAGDVLVTLWGIQQPGIHEAVPISRWALSTAGPLGLVVKDAAVLLGFYLFYRVAPVPFCWSVPLGMLWARSYLVVQNLVVLGVL